MNKELLGYEDAVKAVKVLEKRQRYYKNNRKRKYSHIIVKDFQDSEYLKRKKDIKILLSLIAAHKQARKLYGTLVDVKKDLGMSSKSYKKVSDIVND